MTEKISRIVYSNGIIITKCFRQAIKALRKKEWKYDPFGEE